MEPLTIQTQTPACLKLGPPVRVYSQDVQSIETLPIQFVVAVGAVHASLAGEGMSGGGRPKVQFESSWGAVELYRGDDESFRWGAASLRGRGGGSPGRRPGARLARLAREWRPSTTHFMGSTYSGEIPPWLYDSITATSRAGWPPILPVFMSSTVGPPIRMFNGTGGDMCTGCVSTEVSGIEPAEYRDWFTAIRGAWTPELRGTAWACVDISGLREWYEDYVAQATAQRPSVMGARLAQLESYTRTHSVFWQSGKLDGGGTCPCGFGRLLPFGIQRTTRHWSLDPVVAWRRAEVDTDVVTLPLPRPGGNSRFVCLERRALRLAPRAETIPMVRVVGSRGVEAWTPLEGALDVLQVNPASFEGIGEASQFTRMPSNQIPRFSVMDCPFIGVRAPIEDETSVVWTLEPRGLDELVLVRVPYSESWSHECNSCTLPYSAFEEHALCSYCALMNASGTNAANIMENRREVFAL